MRIKVLIYCIIIIPLGGLQGDTAPVTIRESLTPEFFYHLISKLWKLNFTYESNLSFLQDQIEDEISKGSHFSPERGVKKFALLYYGYCFNTLSHLADYRLYFS